LNQALSERDAEFYAQTYDVSVPDWPGELDFYREMAAEVKSTGETILEIACGTGRVAIRLAQEGVNVVGLDHSPKMLEVASQKSAGLNNICWVEGDMRSFELSQMFGLAIIPGHAFQHMNTPQDQVACLECIKRHLNPGGRLVLHLDYPDFPWFGDLLEEKGGRFDEAEKFINPKTGRQVRATRAWSFETSTQTAICQTAWEEVDDEGQVIDRWQTKPVRLHVVFRFEIEHLLARAGFTVEGLFGDFFRNPLQDNSPNMIWVAR
jgi:ubiquinone/menaquinone biosynthesis C-methylase UbiE